MLCGGVGRTLCVMAAERAKFASDELAMVLSHYALGIVQEVTEFPRGSHAAAKVILKTNQGKYLIKRRPLGKDDPYQVAFAHSLQQFLATKNFPLPHLIGTREQNNSMLKIGPAIYEVFEFIDGTHYDGGLLATYEAGKTLALYHLLVGGFHSEWEPPRGHYHDSKMVHESFQPMAQILIKSSSAQGHQTELVNLLVEIRKQYKVAADQVNALGMPQWQTQIVHSDWHPGNMLFDEGRVVAVLDYDSARIRPRVMDVANGCLQFSMITGGRDVTTWRSETDALRAQRFLRGYDEMNMLSKAELGAIPSLMQEVLIAQSIPPILKTGTFAGLDGFEFLKATSRKVRWLAENQGWILLDEEAA